MGNQFRVEVYESSEELEHRLRHALTATTKERVQMLYWLKTQAITSICGWDYIVSALLSATS